MSIEIFVQNTHHELFAPQYDIKLAVTEVGCDPAVVTLGSRASRTFTVANVSDLQITSGSEFADVSYPAGMPVGAPKAAPAAAASKAPTK